MSTDPTATDDPTDDGDPVVNSILDCITGHFDTDLFGPFPMIVVDRSEGHLSINRTYAGPHVRITVERVA
jgi:hypothetical protein